MRGHAGRAMRSWSKKPSPSRAASGGRWRRVARRRHCWGYRAINHKGHQEHQDVGYCQARLGALCGEIRIYGQPLRALLTAWISSLISTRPLPDGSNAGQFCSGKFPSAMLTPTISSLISTMQLPSQSPTPEAGGGVSVGVAAGVVASLDGVAVAVPAG